MFKNMFRLAVPSKSIIRNMFNSKLELHNNRVLSNIINNVCAENTTSEIELENSKKIVKEVLDQLMLNNPEFGKNSTVGKDVSIGNNVVIKSGVVIKDNTYIGVNTMFGVNTNIGHRVTVGDRVTLLDITYIEENDTCQTLGELNLE